jgi:hypothetical protein
MGISNFQQAVGSHGQASSAKRVSVMVHFSCFGDIPRRLGRWASVATVVACLGLPGCCHNNLDLRGEKFPESPLAAQARALRQNDSKTKSEAPWAITNKGQQIEEDLKMQR